MGNRASGILLHISSLPSEYGIGDLGPAAYRFADFLNRAGQRCWQVLPINQVDPRSNYSPYNCLSAFAGNVLLISPELLVEDGFLSRKDIHNKPVFSKSEVNFRPVWSYKQKLLNIAYERFKNRAVPQRYRRFCSDNRRWLGDYALFMAATDEFGHRPWHTWPNKLRDRKTEALKSMKIELADSISGQKFQQYVFSIQWSRLKKYCNRLGIRIIGDIPIYVSRDAADTWTHRELFKLTKTKEPRFIAGVPPDLFNKTGQLWGNTVYNWKALKKTGFRWWIERIGHNLTLFDIVRLDHFRGFVSYWQVPAGSETARKGRWVRGPGKDFFDELFRHFPSSRFIAEDLGFITGDVRKLVDRYGLTGTKVLMFGFDGDVSTNPDYPRNYVTDSVVYTGTHDNNTVRGWFKNQASPAEKRNVFCCLGRRVPLGQLNWEFIKLATSSVSDTVIIPMQDVLGLGQESRMNKPGTVNNNWKWRLQPNDLKPATAKKLAGLAAVYERA